VTLTSSATPDLVLPKGVKDFLPLKAAKLEHLSHTVRGVFDQWGFRPILPPALELLSVLERGLGDGLRERVFRFDDRQGGRLVAFPPDMTPQVARIVATRMQALPLPLRLCYSGRVLRHAEEQAGKDREIFQAGVELIGLDSVEADAEMIAMAISALKALGVKEFTIDVGQVDFFRGIMDELSLEPAAAQKLKVAIASKDSSGLKTLLAGLELSTELREAVLALPRLFGGREVLTRAAKVAGNERSCAALRQLEEVFDILETYGVEEHVTVDLGELQGLDYHTGITFSGYLSGVGRAVCSGGRYDNLMARYGFPAPATGFTFDLQALLFALDAGLGTVAGMSTDLLIFQVGGDKQPAQRLARALREQGHSVARDMIQRDLEASLDYARRLNYRYLLIVNTIDEPVRLLCLANNHELELPFATILAGDFELSN